MSEYVNNRAKRQEILKRLIRELHEGKTVEDVKQEFAALLREALTDFAAVLRSGGLLLIQNRNFDAIMRDRVRWMGPQLHHEGDREWLFVRFYDFNVDGTLTFNVVTLRRDETDEWTQQVEATTLRPLLHTELSSAIAAAGFGGLACYGDMTGAPFDPETSGNLIVTARKKRLL